MRGGLFVAFLDLGEDLGFAEICEGSLYVSPLFIVTADGDVELRVRSLLRLCQEPLEVHLCRRVTPGRTSRVQDCPLGIAVGNEVLHDCYEDRSQQEHLQIRPGKNRVFHFLSQSSFSHTLKRNSNG